MMKAGESSTGLSISCVAIKSGQIPNSANHQPGDLGREYKESNQRFGKPPVDSLFPPGDLGREYKESNQRLGNHPLIFCFFYHTRCVSSLETVKTPRLPFQM